MQHDGSAYLSTKRAIESAEDRGFDAGLRIGMTRRAEMDIEYLEANGFTEAAEALRQTKIVRKEQSS